MNTIEERIQSVRKIDPDDLEKSYEIWKPIGMLDGLDSVDIEKKVASEFTKMAKYLLFSDGAYMNSITVCAFPTVRKIFASGYPVKEYYSPEAVCEELQNKLKQIANMQAQHDTGLDIEAVSCAEVAKLFYEADDQIK